MNVLFKCCQCLNELKKEVHSYNKNASFKGKLCEHFSEVYFRWNTSFGFFTLGWKVEIKDVFVRCNLCQNWLHFNDATFNSKHNIHKEFLECHNNVVIYNANEGYYEQTNNGYELQNRINRKREEMARFEREQKINREKEEKLRKEKIINQQIEKKQMNEIIKQQEKESNELEIYFNTDISWIDIQMNEKNEKSDKIFTEIMNFDAKKMIEQNFNFQMIKS